MISNWGVNASEVYNFCYVSYKVQGAGLAVILVQNYISEIHSFFIHFEDPLKALPTYFWGAPRVAFIFVVARLIGQSPFLMPVWCHNFKSTFTVSL